MLKRPLATHTTTRAQLLTHNYLANFGTAAAAAIAAKPPKRTQSKNKLRSREYFPELYDVKSQVLRTRARHKRLSLRVHQKHTHTHKAYKHTPAREHEMQHVCNAHNIAGTDRQQRWWWIHTKVVHEGIYYITSGWISPLASSLSFSLFYLLFVLPASFTQRSALWCSAGSTLACSMHVVDYSRVRVLFVSVEPPTRST